jgi:hypothetical protein
MPTLLLSLLCLGAAPERFGALEVPVPAGFTRDGNRLVSEHSQWVFEPETSTRDPEKWATAALASVTGSRREPRATPLVHQTNRNGLEVWMSVGSGYNEAGRLVFFGVFSAHDGATGRAQTSRYLTDTQDRLNAERALLSPAASNFAFKGPPPPQQPTARPAKQPPVAAAPVAAAPEGGSLPDGSYTCSRLKLVMGYRGMMQPDYEPSFINNIVGKVILRGNHYEAVVLKKGGTVRQAGARLTFVDGPLAGWVAATGRNSAGPFFRVRLGSSADPGAQVKVGDDVCTGHK